MPRPKNTEARRAQIVDAFLTLLAERGFDGASMSAVAKAAGLNQGLIHYHFDNKQAVLLAALETLAREHEARLDDAYAAAGDDPLAQVSAFLDAHLGLGAHADPRALAAWVVIGAEALRSPPVRDAYGAAIDALTRRLEETLARARAAGLIRHEHPAAAAAALLAVVQGYFDLAAAAPGRIPRGTAAESARAMAQGILQPARPLEAP